MAKSPISKNKPAKSPFVVRLNEVAGKLQKAHDNSGVDKADMIRMAVDAFLDAHATPEAIIAAAIKYRTHRAKAWN